MSASIRSAGVLVALSLVGSGACAAGDRSQPRDPEIRQPTATVDATGPALTASPERRPLLPDLTGEPAAAPPPPPSPPPKPTDVAGCTWHLHWTQPPVRPRSGCGSCQDDIDRAHAEAVARFVPRQVWICDECKTNDDCAARGSPGYCRAGRDPSGAHRFTCRSHPCRDDEQYEPGKGCIPQAPPP